jgi:hypothetical protein
MSAPAAFQATIHSFRTVPSRGVVSITIEAPIEQHATIAAIAEHGAWVGVARIQNPAGEQQEPKRKEYSLPQRVAMVCNEPAFWRFLVEHYIAILGFNITAAEKEIATDAAADAVRVICHVKSRSEILPGTEAAKRWDKLHAEYLLWSQS